MSRSHKSPRMALISVGVILAPAIAWAFHVTPPANPLAGGVVVGTLDERVLCHANGCAAGSYTIFELDHVGTLAASGDELEASFGDNGTAAVAFASMPSPAPLNLADISATGSVRAAYQIEYVVPGADPGTMHTVSMTAADTLSASGAPFFLGARLTVIDSADGSLTPPVLTPPAPGNSPPPPGNPGNPPPPPGGPLGPPQAGVVYDQYDCVGGAVVGCFGGAPLTGASFSILENEPYDVIMDVSLGMNNEVDQLVSGSASIDPVFKVVDPVPGGTFYVSSSAAPEPSSWIALLLGAGMVGGSLRRRAGLITAGARCRDTSSGGRSVTRH